MSCVSCNHTECACECSTCRATVLNAIAGQIAPCPCVSCQLMRRARARRVHAPIDKTEGDIGIAVDNANNIEHARRLLQLEDAVDDIGDQLEGALAGAAGASTRFVLLVFDVETPGAAFMTNAARDKAFAVLDDFLARLEAAEAVSDEMEKP
jgi:hypothetical protein